VRVCRGEWGTRLVVYSLSCPRVSAKLAPLGLWPPYLRPTYGYAAVRQLRPLATAALPVECRLAACELRDAGALRHADAGVAVCVVRAPLRTPAGFDETVCVF